MIHDSIRAGAAHPAPAAADAAMSYAELLAEKRAAERELSLAGQIQASFLPRTLPRVPGWQLTATLRSARQTCGDFYDVFPLPNGRVGLVMADVADKGTPAALYMALSRTLIRTFAIIYHTRPDYALRAANHRLLADSDSDLFVTTFLGVLDPAGGTLTYSNAGHNPPFLVRADDARPLTHTGIPLGMFIGQEWKSRSVTIAPGELLLLYTDGVTEAHNGDAHLFASERLLAVARAHRHEPAQAVQQAVLNAVATFTGDAPQFDDIALLVVKRPVTPPT
jgi:sigma-B regulation protein RsbU (phosphoserine phosphatase)